MCGPVAMWMVSGILWDFKIVKKKSCTGHYRMQYCAKPFMTDSCNYELACLKKKKRRKKERERERERKKKEASKQASKQETVEYLVTCTEVYSHSSCHRSGRSLWLQSFRHDHHRHSFDKNYHHRCRLPQTLQWFHCSRPHHGGWECCAQIVHTLGPSFPLEQYFQSLKGLTQCTLHNTKEKKMWYTASTTCSNPLVPTLFLCSEWYYLGTRYCKNLTHSEDLSRLAASLEWDPTSKWVRLAQMCETLSMFNLNSQL